MRPQSRKPVPAHLRHRIVPAATGFELRTHCGYVLHTFTTLEDARAYYAWHCPEI